MNWDWRISYLLEGKWPNHLFPLQKNSTGTLWNLFKEREREQWAVLID